MEQRGSDGDGPRGRRPDEALTWRRTVAEATGWRRSGGAGGDWLQGMRPSSHTAACHLATDAGKEIANKVGFVYQLNISPKKMGVDKEIFVVDVKKGAVSTGLDSSRDLQGEGAEKKEGKAAEKKSKCVRGSVKRKLKKQKPKKEDSNGDAPSETAEKEQEAPIEEEKIEMTLEEYEKMQEKKKSLEASKPEGRKVADLVFEGLKLLGKKKIEDDAKAENGPKAKEAAPKEAKPRKEYLKNEDGSEYVPPTPVRRPQNGGFTGGHGNGAYNGRSSRDSNSERRVYNSGRGDNAIVFHGVEANAKDSGAPRRGEGYNGERRDQQQGGYYQQGGYQQGGYNGGRGNGRYQERQDGERRDQQHGGYCLQWRPQGARWVMEKIIVRALQELPADQLDQPASQELLDSVWGDVPKEHKDRTSKKYLHVAFDKMDASVNLPPYGAVNQVDAVVNEAFKMANADDGKAVDEAEFL
ncbi:hypothetical protein D1007_24877 [Hordeum vulgare]|nr:hypothetical protein D1007_24877 [Hordeum vulgare]